MGIVRFALKFPHTFYVVAALILFLGIGAISSMPTDIFPEIRIPVVTVIWQYTGLSTPEMEERVSTYSQYVLSPVYPIFECERHPGYRGADAQRNIGSEGLLSTRRQSRSRDLADRVRNQFYPCLDASGDPGAGRGPVQCVERSSAADRPECRHAQ